MHMRYLKPSSALALIATTTVVWILNDFDRNFNINKATKENSVEVERVKNEVDGGIALQRLMLTRQSDTVLMRELDSIQRCADSSWSEMNAIANKRMPVSTFFSFSQGTQEIAINRAGSRALATMESLLEKVRRFPNRIDSLRRAPNSLKSNAALQKRI
jgi:hypothetical protein